MEIEVEQGWVPVVVPSGAYEAKVKEVELGVKGEFGICMRIHFEFEHEGKKYILQKLTSEKITTMNAAGAIFSAVLGKPITVGMKLEPQDLVGKKCKILTARKQFKTRKGELLDQSTVEKVERA